jgi:gliding motility-associated-like protein
MRRVVKPRSFTNIFFTFLVIFSMNALGQGISTEGKEFWVSYLTNWLQSSNNPVILELYISADDTTSGIVTMPRVPGFNPMEFKVLPNATEKITIPTSIAMPSGSNIIENKGILIQTDGTVSVYAMNKRQYSADMTVVLPTYSLGNNYYVMSHWEDGNRNNNENSDSEFVILAITDSTEVEITPSFDTKGGNPANVPFRVMLHKGQTYQVKAVGDLTGTHITATNLSGCQNFAVFSGNMYTQVGECDVVNGHDHLYAQMYPTNTLGKNFIVVPLENRFGGDIIKLLATKDNTNVTTSMGNYNLDAGEFVKLLSEDILEVASDQPISVGQFSRTMDCDGTLGDPFLIPISPNEQLLKKITFNAPSIATLSRYSLNIVTKQESVSTITLDNNFIGNEFISIPGSEYAYARLGTSGGNHTIRSSDGFIAYVYGFGRNESFGYATGASLGNLNIDVAIQDQYPDTPIDSLCLGSEISFTPEVDSIYKYFEYDFGDGHSFYADMDTTVFHKYTQTGEYLVTFKATTGGDDCSNGNEEISVKLIRVIQPLVDIFGPRSVCPNTSDVAYFINERLGHNIDWYVTGGSIESVNRDSLRVTWHGTNNNAEVKVIATNRYGCPSDTIRHPVKINIQLDPEAPFGPDTLCSDNIVEIPYSAYYTNVSTYQWETDFGTVSKGNGTNEVTVNWDSFGIGQLWFQQLSITDTICDGTSDTLQVYIQRNPSETGQITTEADTLYIGEEFELKLDVDTLFQFVNWEIDDGTQHDTLNSKMPVNHTFECDGWHTIHAVAYDTGTVCSETKAYLEKEIFVVPPSIEIINVTRPDNGDSILVVHFKLDNIKYYDKNFYLYRRTLGDIDWKLIGTFDTSKSSFTDREVDINQNIYEYKIETNTDCVNNISSAIHQSVLLTAEQDDKEATISWSEYIGWENGVEHYEIWVSIDSGDYQLLETTTDWQLNYPNKNEGFDHCFVVKAYERNGNEAISLSNVSCVSFVPEIKTYNVITPNRSNYVDAYNEYFTVDNIEHYPRSRLIILNRYGKIIFETTGYSNNWNGKVNGNPIPSGTYFYELKLNEPRNEINMIRGYFSVLY